MGRRLFISELSSANQQSTVRGSSMIHCGNDTGPQRPMSTTYPCPRGHRHTQRHTGRLTTQYCMPCAYIGPLHRDAVPKGPRTGRDRDYPRTQTEDVHQRTIASPCHILFDPTSPSTLPSAVNLLRPFPPPVLQPNFPASAAHILARTSPELPLGSPRSPSASHQPASFRI